MSFAVIFLTFLVAVPVFVFGLAQPLIACRVALPVTKVLEQMYPGRFPAREVRKRATATILVWTTLFVAILAIVIAFGNLSVRIGILSGLAVATVLLLPKTRYSPSTLADYFSAYGSLFDDDLLNDMRKDGIDCGN